MSDAFVTARDRRAETAAADESTTSKEDGIVPDLEAGVALFVRRNRVLEFVWPTIDATVSPFVSVVVRDGEPIDAKHHVPETLVSRLDGSEEIVDASDVGIDAPETAATGDQ